jgi:hypothetical protein
VPLQQQRQVGQGPGRTDKVCHHTPPLDERASHQASTAPGFTPGDKTGSQACRAGSATSSRRLNQLDDIAELGDQNSCMCSQPVIIALVRSPAGCSRYPGFRLIEHDMSQRSFGCLLSFWSAGHVAGVQMQIRKANFNARHSSLVRDESMRRGVGECGEKKKRKETVATM